MRQTDTGALIAQLRKEQGLTQKQLADQLHISDRTISKWERGAGFPDVSLLEPLADALHCSVVSLLEGRLVDAGNTVVVIEHNLDVIKCADHLIDLGPEGGDGGGTIVVTGTPEEVAACPASFTGQYLKRMLN